MPPSASTHFSRIAMLFLLPLFAAGCGFEQARYTQTSTYTAPHTAQSGIKITTQNGSIAVRKATDSTAISITATLRMVTAERLGQVTINANPNTEGVFEISAEPPAGGWRSGEGCGFDVTLPEATGVDLKTSNGAIKIAGLAGRAKLDTSNGSISVSGHGGDIDADTSNGHVEATGVEGRVAVRTSNGGVDVSLSDASEGPVQIRTSNGAVTLGLGRDYRGELSIDTSNGSIRLPQSGPSGVSLQIRQAKRHATMVVGDAEPKSTIDTSNGSVTVRFTQ